MFEELKAQKLNGLTEGEVKKKGTQWTSVSTLYKKQKKLCNK
jgi:hypothetical protein